MTAAAFFDLDRTLDRGLVRVLLGARGARRGHDQPPPDGRGTCWHNVRFRLQGSTDAGDRRGARARSREMIARPARDRPAAHDAARSSRACCRASTRRCSQVAYEHQDAGRRVYIATAASQEMADMLAHVLGLRRRDRRALGDRRRRLHRPRRRARSPTARARRSAMRELAEARGHRPRRLVRLLRLGVRPADAARRRPSGGGQPGRRARRGSPRDEGWDVLRFEQLGRRLLAAGALVGMGVVGTAGRGAVAPGDRAAAPPRRACARDDGAREPPRPDRRAARHPRPGAPLRRRGGRAAGRRLGPRAPVPAGRPRRSSASSG